MNIDKLRSSYSSSQRKSVPNDYINTEIGPISAYIGGMILGGVTFGSIHVAGWNLELPTPIEQKLWRIASILMTCLLPVVFISPLLAGSGISLFDFLDQGKSWVSVQSWTFVLGIIYIAARLFTLVEIFRTLLYLPLDAYISIWALNIPHVS